MSIDFNEVLKEIRDSDRKDAIAAMRLRGSRGRRIRNFNQLALAAANKQAVVFARCWTRHPMPAVFFMNMIASVVHHRLVEGVWIYRKPAKKKSAKSPWNEIYKGYGSSAKFNKMRPKPSVKDLTTDIPY